jgi:hypothetical protein
LATRQTGKLNRAEVRNTLSLAALGQPSASIQICTSRSLRKALEHYKAFSAIDDACEPMYISHIAAFVFKVEAANRIEMAF